MSWKSISELRKTEHVLYNKRYKNNKEVDMYLRLNDNQVEYSLDKEDVEYDSNVFKDKLHDYEYDEDIFKTRAGEIELCDNGEFGGYLAIGSRYITKGNFCHIFKFKDRKFVVDCLRHFLTSDFRLYEVFDNATINNVYDTDDFSGGSILSDGPHFEMYIVDEDNIHIIANNIRKYSEDDKQFHNDNTLYYTRYNGE